MPLVQRYVQEFFKKQLDQRINPDEVVALGAAIQAHALARAKRRPSKGKGEAKGVNEATGEGARKGTAPEPAKREEAKSPEIVPAPPAAKAEGIKEIRTKRFDPRAEPEEEAAPSPPPLPRREPATAKKEPPPPPAAAESSVSFARAAPSLHWSSIPPVLGPPTPLDSPPQAPAPSLSLDVPELPVEPRIPVRPLALDPPQETKPEKVTNKAQIGEGESLLIDVTPLSLRVETVGGYSDVLIGANSQVPCDRTRVFSTASNDQTQVFVRVAQGESTTFADNTFLGELELAGLVPLPRGDAQIAVTFEIDADGILAVHAKDERTGKETRAKMHVFGAQTEEGDVDRMMRRQKQRNVV
jgi:molecular chaperone DnaK